MSVTITTSHPASSLTVLAHDDEDVGPTAKGVHFDEACILIPESQLNSPKRPRVTTKSYSLPIWRKKIPDAASSDTELDADESRVVVKVPLPSFSFKYSSLSPTVEARPLHPCLVNRTPEPHHRSVSDSVQELHPRRTLVRQIAQSSPRSLTRSPSATRTSPRSPPRTDLTAVPLRACCPGCVAVTEASLHQGDSWETKFTRGARRRRNSDLDSVAPGSGASFAAVTVDEVSKHHQEHSHADALVERLHIAIPSLADDADSPRAALPASLSRKAARPPPRIVEEDESQLFPLPSPRRTPSASPSGSHTSSPATSSAFLPLKNGSQESLNVGNIRRRSPLPSPSPLSTHPSTLEVGPARAPRTSSSPPQAISRFNVDGLYAKRGTGVGSPAMEPRLPAITGLARSRSHDDAVSGTAAAARRLPPHPRSSHAQQPQQQASTSPSLGRARSSSFLRTGVNILKGVTAIGGVSF